MSREPTPSKSKHYKQKIEQLNGQQLLQQQLPQKKQGSKLDKIQSARQTRMRKKIYISLLEQRLRAKQAEINELKAELGKFRQTRPPESLRNRTDLFVQIEESVRRQEQQRTQDLLDVLRVRYGVGGEDRKALLEAALRQFIEYMMPMHFRLLMESCQEKKEFYELFAENQQYKVHMNFSFLSPAQKRQLIKIRPLLFQYKHAYNHLITKIHELKRAVITQNNLSQHIIDGLSHAFKPCFVAEFLLKLDQKRTREKHMNNIYPLSYWEEVCKVRAEEDRRRALGQVYEFDVEGEEDYRQQPPPEMVFNQQEELDFLI